MVFLGSLVTFEFLRVHGYFIIFIFMIAEGPIVTYLASVAASLGIFNIYYIAILSILGNLAGDVILFSIGRMGYGSVLKRFFPKLTNDKRLEKTFRHLEKNPWKTLAIVKSIPALPLPGLIFVGTTDMRFEKFLMYSFVLSLPYTVIPVILGLFSGLAANEVSSYIEFSSFAFGAFILLSILLWFTLNKLIEKFGTRLTKQ